MTHLPDDFGENERLSPTINPSRTNGRRVALFLPSLEGVELDQVDGTGQSNQRQPINWERKILM